MNYDKKSFSVAVGTEEYRDSWDRIFGRKIPEKREPKKLTVISPLCHNDHHEECQSANLMAIICDCECHT